MGNQIEQILSKFEFVQWDRYTNPSVGEYHFYGWIEREDSYKDFLVLVIISGDIDYFITSSAKYTDRVSEIVYGVLDSEDHNPCIRVEERFNVLNMIKLKYEKGS